MAGHPSPPQVSVYDIGDLARVVASFVGTDGVTPGNPSMVTLQVMDPLGSVASVRFGVGSIALVGTAAYAHDFTITMAGSWFYRWEGTGGVQAADVWSLLGERDVFHL